MDDMLFDALENAEYEDFEGDADGETFDLDDSIEGEYDDFGEDEFDDFGDGEDAESRRSRRRARKRQRRIAAIRRRQLRRNRRPRRPMPRRASPKQRIAKNHAKIRRVGLESAVKSDALANGLRSQSKRISGTEYAVTAGKVIDEVRAQFPDLDKNKLIKTALPLAPLLFLKPPKRGTGLQAAALDPRIWGPVLAAGAALFNEFRDKNDEPRELSVSPANVVLNTGSTFGFSAIVRDQSGKIISGRNVEWATLNESVATVNKETGQVTAVAKGDVTIIAKDLATGLTNAVVISVK